MIRHLFLLTWNKRNQHIFLLAELFLFFLASSFLAFALVSSRAFYSETKNIDVDRVVEVRWNASGPQEKRLIKENYLLMKSVQSVSHTDFIPYRFGFSQMVVGVDSTIDNAYQIHADEDLQKMLGFKILEGRWFKRDDIYSPGGVIIIGQNMRKGFFPNTSAVGKKVTIGQMHPMVIGVSEDIGDISRASDIKNYYFWMDTISGYGSMLVKLKTPLNEKIYQEMRQVLKHTMTGPNDYDGINPISQYKQDKENNTKSFFSVLSIVAGFLIVNIVLGLYSTLYQTINKRKGEIGIRRAAGATSGDIYRQIIMEVLALTTLALVLGIIAGYQFMLFDVLEGKPVDYVIGMITATVFIYALVSLCALYPAYLAAKIHPAEALHDD
ncbi:ABC transporter permease [Pedobacter sp. GR22-6]|uniref:ABC transporter permease n=1 Tax=Pedobacter sp. GR22-6 TaxID=3127957 RepID=UPI00307D4163